MPPFVSIIVLLFSSRVSLVVAIVHISALTILYASAAMAMSGAASMPGMASALASMSVVVMMMMPSVPARIIRMQCTCAAKGASSIRASWAVSTGRARITTPIAICQTIVFVIVALVSAILGLGAEMVDNTGSNCTAEGAQNSMMASLVSNKTTSRGTERNGA